MSIDTTVPDRNDRPLLGAAVRGNFRVLVTELRGRLERDVTARLSGVLVVSGVLVLAALPVLPVSSGVGLSAAGILIPGAIFFIVRISDVFAGATVRRARLYLWLIRAERTKASPPKVDALPTALDQLLVQQYFLQIFDKVENQLRDVVATSIGDISGSMSLRDVVRSASDLGLLNEVDLKNWVEALTVRRELLNAVHCEPSLTSLTVTAARLRHIYLNLDSLKKSIIDSDSALSAIDDQMVSRAVKCLD
jgi:hypothetical protein